MMELQWHSKIVHHPLSVSQKINGTSIDDSEHLDFVIQMYNLLEYSSSYSGTRFSFSFYSKDEATNFTNDIEKTGKCFQNPGSIKFN